MILLKFEIEFELGCYSNNIIDVNFYQGIGKHLLGEVGIVYM